MGKGRTTIQPPEQISAAQAEGEYLFGPDFTDFQGVTDPRLQQRLLGAERVGREAYTGLELRDIGTMARGIEAGQANPEYQRIQSEIAALEAGGQASGRLPSRKELEATANKLYPVSGGRIRNNAERQRNEKNKKLRKQYIESGGSKGKRSTARAEELASLRSRLKSTPKTLDKTAGLFDLLEESSIRAGDLQRRQLGQQRADDVAALQRFAPQVVRAYRDADPFSTEIAEAASAEAMRGPSETEQLLGQRALEFAASTGELTPLEARRAQQSARQASLAQGRELGQGALAQEIANRFAEETGKREREISFGSRLLGQQAGLQQQRFGQLGGAFGMNRQLAGDAGNIILGRPSAAIGLGQQTLGQAQAGAAGPMGPQLFDPNVGINMAMQNQANQFGLLGAQAQANAARSAGGLGAFGSIVGGFLGGR